MDSEEHIPPSQPSGARGIPFSAPNDIPGSPLIPDHKLLRCIGRGSYGVVWIAQNTMGAYRAVKIIYRDSFKEDRPFQRELSGIRKFEPVSRSHEGFVHILHVGINEPAGYFYYIMELGDDQFSGQTIVPENYVPRTLAKDISPQAKLSVKECLHLGLALSLALAELHKRGLVHRDVKPSNIIFVNGVPKLADIGLVTEANEARSYVGTEGFIPPEGPGAAQADIYSLGKVLYEACTGKDRQDFPELPANLDTIVDRSALLELNEVILAACKNDIAKRYQSAWEMHADLLILINGKSVRRLKILEQRLAQVKRIAGITAVIALATGLVLFQIYRSWRMGIETRQREVGEGLAYGNRAVESGDLLGALPYFAEVLRLDGNDKKEEAAHRLLFASTLGQCPKLNHIWFMNPDVRDGEFNSNGTQILVSEYNGGTRIYDLASQTMHGKETNLCSWVCSANWSPDGQFAVSASEDTNAYIWDVETSRIIKLLPHPGVVMWARFSPDGSRVVTACLDGIVRLWDAHLGKLELSFIGHTQGVRFADFSHDGRFIVSASQDQTVRLWDVTTGLPVGKPLWHESWVNYAAFSPDDKTLITGSSDCKARFWDVATGRRLLIDLKHEDGVESAEFSPDGKMVITASLDGTARIWELDSLQSINLLLILRHTAGVTHASFSSDGHHILTICTDGSIRLWDLAGSASPPSTTRYLINQDGSRLLSQTGSQLTVKEDASGTATVLPIVLPPEMRSRAVSKNGHFVLCISESESNQPTQKPVIRVVDTIAGKIMGSDLSLSCAFTNGSISDDGKNVVVFGSVDLELLGTGEGARKIPILSVDDIVKSAFFSPDGKLLAAWTTNSLKLWDLAGQSVFATNRFEMPIVYAAFSPDSRYVVICFSDELIHKCCARILDLSTGRFIGELWHTDGVLFAAFSPDSKRIVTASEDRTAKVWDVLTAKQLIPDLKHGEHVRSAEFSPDGLWIVTACSDKTVRIWNAATGDPLTPQLRQLARFSKAQFLVNGYQIATSDDTGNSWFWQLPTIETTPEDAKSLASLLAGKGNPAANEDNSEAHSLPLLWQNMYAKYPSIFDTSIQNTAEWEEAQVEGCEVKQQWFAERFHLQRLQSETSRDEALNARLAKAEKRLQAGD